MDQPMYTTSYASLMEIAWKPVPYRNEYYKNICPTFNIPSLGVYACHCGNVPIPLVNGAPAYVVFNPRTCATCKVAYVWLCNGCRYNEKSYLKYVLPEMRMKHDASHHTYTPWLVPSANGDTPDTRALVSLNSTVLNMCYRCKQLQFQLMKDLAQHDMNILCEKCNAALGLYCDEDNLAQL